MSPSRFGVELAALRRRYGEPARRYHDGRHLDEVLTEIARLAAFEPEADREAVTLAGWYHDAVYDVRGGAGENEEASALLAQAELRRAQRPEVLVAEVGRLVRLTAGHQVDPSDRSGAVLIDADLWILSAPEGRYDCYVDDVREEYAHVPAEGWATGRGHLLRSFLEKAHSQALYGAGEPGDRAARNLRAAANLSRELGSLDSPAS